MSEQRKLSQRVLKRLAPPLIAAFLRLLASTWRVRVLNVANAPAKQVTDPPRVFAHWHDTIVPIIGVFRGLPIQGLASQSFDGELIADALQRLGFPPPARGSSSRGGAEALRILTRGLKAGLHATVTVDGPRGPRWQATEGTAKLAQLSGCPMLPVGLAVRGAFRLRNWDRTILPLPFARLTFAFGEPIPVNRDLEDLGSALTILQKQLDDLTALAEADLSR